MKSLRKTAAFGVFALGLAFAMPLFARPAMAASDPIAEFCAGPVAKADADAVAQCADYAKSLAESTAKKGEVDTAQAAINEINAQINLALQKIKL